MLKAEKDVSLSIDFSFLMNSINVGKDDNYIHFLTEFIDGISFEDVLMELEFFTDEQT